MYVIEDWHAAVGRAPQAGDAGCDTGERVGARRTGQTDGRGRCVLLVVCVQDQDAVQGAHQHVVDLVLFARVREHHVHEVGAVRQVVAWVHERLADVVLVGHRDQGRQLGDQADCRDFALLGIVDVQRVVVERRQRADRTDQHRHRVRVTAEATEEEVHLLMDHRVLGHGVGEHFFLLCVWQFAVQQQVAGFQEVAVDGQLLDRVTAVQQLALVTVDVGDARVTGGGRHEARIVRELAGRAVQLADVDDVRADGAFVDRHVDRRAAVRERQGGFGIRDVHGTSFLWEWVYKIKRNRGASRRAA